MKEEWISKIGIRMGDEHIVKAPEGLLEDIKAEMERRAITPVATRKKKNVPLLRHCSVAAAILVCGIFLWYSLQQDQTTQRQTGNRQGMTLPNPINTASISSIKNTNKSSTSYPDASTNEHRIKVGQFLASAAAAPAVMPVMPAADGQEMPETTQTILPDTLKEEKTERSERIIRKEESRLYDDNTALSTRHIHGAASSQFSISTSYGSSGGFSRSAQGVLLAVANPIGVYGVDFSGGNIKDAIVGLGERKTKHYQPIKFGISARYRFNDRWSFQTGIAYSYLSSEFSYGEEGLTYVKEQKLHYVGIPLAVNYHFIQDKKINIYATAGCETEKLMKGKLSEQGNNSRYEGTSSIPVKEKPLQFSIRGAVGAEYMFGGNISAYIEPGVSYHFNNGSRVENIYKEKPINLSIHIGLRVNINK